MGPPEWIIIGIVALVVVFGAKKIPEMARSMGRAQSEFKKGMKEGQADLDETPPATPPPTATPPTATPAVQPPTVAAPPAAQPAAEPPAQPVTEERPQQPTTQ
jgi:sec-independent protein translocase protein TatA